MSSLMFGSTPIDRRKHTTSTLQHSIAFTRREDIEMISLLSCLNTTTSSIVSVITPTYFINSVL